MTKYLTAVLGICVVCILGASCSKKAETVAANETAEQIMEAGNKARNAAKEIVSKDWPDTMQLQLAILDARAESSIYEIEGKKKCKDYFDSTFYSTIRTVRPDLADQLTKQ